MRYLIFLLILVTPGNSQQPFWRSIGGPAGGGVVSYAISDSAMLLGCLLDGVYRMPRGETDWRRTTLSGIDVTALLTLNDTTFLAAPRNEGLRRTTDCGMTWEVFGEGFPSHEVSAFWRVSDSLLLAGFTSVPASQQIFRSTDGGASWHAAIVEADSLAGITTFGEVSAETLFAVNGNLLRSHDHGATWKSVATPSQHVLRFLSVRRNGHLLLASRKNAWFSADAGEQWAEIIPRFEIRGAALGKDDLIILADWGHTMSSTDLGETWYPPGEHPLRVPMISRLERVGESETLAVCSASGLAIQPDEQTEWMKYGNALDINDVIALGVSTRGTLMAVTSHWSDSWESHLKNSGLFRLASGKTQWEKLLPDSSLLIPSTITAEVEGSWSGLNWKKFYRSEDDGETWSATLPDPSIGSVYGPSLGGFYVTSGGAFLLHKKYYGHSRSTAGTIHRSEDGGRTWNVSKSFDDDASLKFAALQRTILIGVNGYVKRGVYRSLDDGRSWEQTGLIFARIFSFATSPSDVFASTDHGVYCSTDDGVTWTIRDSIVVSRLVITPSGSLVAIASDDRNVLLSTDGGRSWSQSTSGLPPFGVLSLTVDRQGRIYAGTRGGGVYASVSTFTAAENEPTTKSESFSLSNYPNPFNGQTHIQFSLEGRTPVTLDIFNLLGQRISVLAEEQSFERGSHSIGWNANCMPAGVYFARLRIVGHPPAVHKVLLIN